MLHTGDVLCRAVPALEPPLQAEALIAAAQRRAGLAGAPGPAERAGLDALIAALKGEAELCLFGRLATRWDFMRLLANLVRLQHEEARDPAILEQPVTRPVFITGLPRSGTTFLHDLLAGDPATLAPRCWQVIHPYPPLGARDRRVAQVQGSLDMFRAFAPAFAGVHPLDADSPQECTDIMAHVFRSLRFSTTYRVPGYSAWLEQAGLEHAYRFHKRFLQHLQRAEDGGAGRQWVLKCPDHVYGLDAIRAAYPDALIVFVHRDPVQVLASVAYLTEVLRQPFTRRLDRAAIGREVSEFWAQAAALMVADSQAGPRDTLHVQFENLVADPLGTVRTITEAAGRRLSAMAEQRIRARLAARPHGRYQHRRYNMAGYGLDPAVERQRFAPYIQRFCRCVCDQLTD